MQAGNKPNDRTELTNKKVRSFPVTSLARREAVSRCCSQFGVFYSSRQVSSERLIVAGRSGVPLLLLLFYFSLSLSLPHSLSLSGLPPLHQTKTCLPPTVPPFVSLLSFPRIQLTYCRNVFRGTNFMDVKFCFNKLLVNSDHENTSIFFCVLCSNQTSYPLNNNRLT